MGIESLLQTLKETSWKNFFFGFLWIALLRKFILWRKKTLEVYKLALALPHEPNPSSVSRFSLDLSGIFKRNFPKGFKSTNEIPKEIVPFLVNHSKKFKDEGLFLVWMANYKFSPIPLCNIYIRDINLAKEMLKSKYNGVFEKGGAYDVVEGLLGKGLVSVHFHNWKEQRYIVEKGFTDKMMETHYPAIMKTTKELIQRLEYLCPGSYAKVNVIHQVQRATLDILGRVAFSYEIGSLKSKGEGKAPLHAAFDTILDILAQRMFSPIKQVLAGLPLKENRKFNEGVRIISQTVYEIIQERKKNKISTVPRDLLDILMADGKLSDKLLVDNIKTLLFAGQDTTAATITWAVHLICKHKEIYDKLQEEIDSLPDEYSIDDIEKLEYMNAFVLEVLRLYPVGGTVRRTKKPVQLGKYLIPPGIDIFCLFFFPHRDEKYYSDPEKCIPERWIRSGEENINLQSKIGKIVREPDQSYGPFSLGNRNCVGRKLALLEMRVILIEIMKRFELRPTEPGEDFQEYPYLTVAQVPRGVRAIFKKK